MNIFDFYEDLKLLDLGEFITTLSSTSSNNEVIDLSIRIPIKTLKQKIEDKKPKIIDTSKYTFKSASEITEEISRYWMIKEREREMFYNEYTQNKKLEKLENKVKDLEERFDDLEYCTTEIENDLYGDDTEWCCECCGYSLDLANEEKEEEYLDTYDNGYEDGVNDAVGIKSILVNEVARVVTVKFLDGDVRIIKCHKEDEFDYNIGVSLAISEHVFGSKTQRSKFIKNNASYVKEKHKKETGEKATKQKSNNKA